MLTIFFLTQSVCLVSVVSASAGLSVCWSGLIIPAGAPFAKVSRREAMYFRRRGVEESDLVLQDPGKYA